MTKPQFRAELQRVLWMVDLANVTLCPVIPAYVLQVKVEMELEIQQYEKAKAVREEQLDRLTQICQEQAVCPLPSRFTACLYKAPCSPLVLSATNHERAANYQGESGSGNENR